MEEKTGTMVLNESIIPTNYRTSKSGRLGRSLDPAEREEKQAQDDKGSRKMAKDGRSRQRN